MNGVETRVGGTAVFACWAAGGGGGFLWGVVDVVAGIAGLAGVVLIHSRVRLENGKMKVNKIGGEGKRGRGMVGGGQGGMDQGERDAYLEGVQETEPMSDLMYGGLAFVVAVDGMRNIGHAAG